MTNSKVVLAYLTGALVCQLSLFAADCVILVNVCFTCNHAISRLSHIDYGQDAGFHFVLLQNVTLYSK